jgi:hypothetical protein
MRQSIVLKTFIGLAAMAAIGGAVFLALTASKEVRGETEVLDAGPETAIQEPVPAAVGETEDWRAYMLGLDAEDYVTYTDAVLGFSFSYPREFELLPATWEDEEVIDLHHPTLPLGMRVSVHPFDPYGELVADLASIPEAYELEAPEGAQTWAVGWIDEDYNGTGQHRSVYWFRAHNRLFEIQLEAPDVAWLDHWMREAAYTDFTLTRPSQDS